MKRRESTTAYCGRKRVLERLLECGGLPAAFSGPAIFQNSILQRRIDLFFYFEYHPLGFPKGVQGMLRTSRCFAGTLLQLGGPDALLGVERYPYEFHCTDFSFAVTQAPTCNGICDSGPKLFATAKRPSLLATAKRTNLLATARRSTAHNPGRNPAMQVVAIG